MLQIRDISVEYQEGIEILRNVSLNIESNKVTSLIGPNGAGKSTLFKTVIGLLKPKRGEIIYDGVRISGKAPEEIVKMGISYIPQRRSIFSQLTVKENLELGGWLLRKKNPEQFRKNINDVLELFPDLAERQNVKAGMLSGGQARMLEIARALVTSPSLLLVDEPSFGLSPIITLQVYKKLEELKRRGITIFLVDQNLGKCIEISDYVYILELGEIKGGGPKENMPSDLNELIRRWFKADEEEYMGHIGGI